MSPTPFGPPMREHFRFADGYRNLNHGSYGTYPISVRDRLRALQEENEATPDIFMHQTRPELLTESRSALACLLHVSLKEIVLVRNASTGLNTVLHNLVYAPGDIVIYFSTLYGAIENAILYQTETTSLRSFKIDYHLPMTHAETLRQFNDAVRTVRQQGKTVRLAVFETISSLPAVRFPFEALVDICRREGILSVIDGAHAVGQIHLDLSTLRPDFFISNCHKWLYTPRGCAFLYVPLKNQPFFRTTLPTSWGFIPAEGIALGMKPPEKSSFEFLFELTATEDDAPYFCIPAALEFRQQVCGGEEAVYNYLQTLSREGSDLMAAIMGTEVMTDDSPDGDLRRCAMTNVQLPLIIGDEEEAKLSDRTSFPVVASRDIGTVRQWIQSQLMNKYNTMVLVYPYAGCFWARVSAQTYLEKGDYEWLATVLKGICEGIGNIHKS